MWCLGTPWRGPWRKCQRFEWERLPQKVGSNVPYWEDELPTLSGWIIKVLMGVKLHISSLLGEIELSIKSSNCNLINQFEVIAHMWLAISLGHYILWTVCI